ncbi:MAG: hypothetical protein MUC77_18130 [Chromatiaceae bacterium]|jgi:CRISPR-associated protein Cmr1|nr:hypothetical protein [Chromatiaceae bacterium]
MRKLEYRVTFTTPAFLGNADQQAQWRTPPFKALLRQWWRVASSRGHQYDHRLLRAAEGELFGNAWLADAAGRPRFRRSRVDLRLNHWESGDQTSQGWPGGVIESVVTTADRRGTVRADVYLGFGPVLPPNRRENRPVTIRGAIAPGKDAVLGLLAEESKNISGSLQLLAWFGTVGSRSRNGWGSFSLTAIDSAPGLTAMPTPGDPLIAEISRDWRQCLDCDWPHALGAASGEPLIWVTKAYENWRGAMGALANVRVEVRRVAKAFVGPGNIGGIHLLGYPAGGKWELPELKKGHPARDHEEARLASQLRFKVYAVGQGLVGAVFHLPHRFPDALSERLSAAQQRWLAERQQPVWAGIHAALNRMPRLAPLRSTK